MADTRSHLIANPTVCHMILISSYLSSWRDYLLYYETILSSAVSKAVDTTHIAKTHTKQHQASYCAALDQPLVNFETLKDVRGIEHHLLLVRPLMQSFSGLLSALKELDARTRVASKDLASDDFVVIDAALDDFRHEARSYIEAADHLCKRTQSIAQSVSDILNLTQSNSTLVLTSLARQDSIAIKALTLVTAFYLPFSFVAVCLIRNR